MLNRIKFPLLIASLVLLISCTEETDYCQTIFNEREELEKFFKQNKMETPGLDYAHCNVLSIVH